MANPVQEAVSVKIALDDSNLESSLKQAQGHLYGFADAAKNLFNKLASAAPFLDAPIKAAVAAFAQFDDAMRQAQVSTGATDAEFRKLSAAANEFALQGKAAASEIAAGFANLSLTRRKSKKPSTQSIILPRRRARKFHKPPTSPRRIIRIASSLFASRAHVRRKT